MAAGYKEREARQREKSIKIFRHFRIVLKK
jgi:hypothetical protein